MGHCILIRAKRSSLQLTLRNSLFVLFAVRFVAVFSGRKNVSVLHNPRIFGLLFLYCNLLLFTVLVSTHTLSPHLSTMLLH